MWPLILRLITEDVRMRDRQDILHILWEHSRQATNNLQLSLACLENTDNYLILISTSNIKWLAFNFFRFELV